MDAGVIIGISVGCGLFAIGMITLLALSFLVCSRQQRKSKKERQTDMLYGSRFARSPHYVNRATHQQQRSSTAPIYVSPHKYVVPIIIPASNQQQQQHRWQYPPILQTPTRNRALSLPSIQPQQVLFQQQATFPIQNSGFPPYFQPLTVMPPQSDSNFTSNVPQMCNNFAESKEEDYEEEQNINTAVIPSSYSGTNYNAQEGTDPSADPNASTNGQVFLLQEFSALSPYCGTGNNKTTKQNMPAQIQQHLSSEQKTSLGTSDEFEIPLHLQYLPQGQEDLQQQQQLEQLQQQQLQLEQLQQQQQLQQQPLQIQRRLSQDAQSNITTIYPPGVRPRHLEAVLQKIDAHEFHCSDAAVCSQPSNLYSLPQHDDCCNANHSYHLSSYAQAQQPLFTATVPILETQPQLQYHPSSYFATDCHREAAPFNDQHMEEPYKHYLQQQQSCWWDDNSFIPNALQQSTQQPYPQHYYGIVNPPPPHVEPSCQQPPTVWL